MVTLNIFTSRPASSETEEESEDTAFGNIGYSLVKTIVMFIGEMDYTDLEFEHWLGYVIFVLFAFLLVIVLMNILNGLAVSDINKIQDEVDTYYHISIVETLAATSFVSLQAEEVIIYPNVKPAYPKILGIPIPGFKVRIVRLSVKQVRRVGNSVFIMKSEHGLACLFYGPSKLHFRQI